MKKQAQIQRTVVDIDLRRLVVVEARGRKPKDVAEVGHETFVRNLLKDKMGWPRREPAPESIKRAAKEIAEMLLDRDRTIAAAKAAQARAAEANATPA